MKIETIRIDYLPGYVGEAVINVNSSLTGAETLHVLEEIVRKLRGGIQDKVVPISLGNSYD